LYARVLWTKRECELAVLSGIVDDLWGKHNAQAVFIDSTGVGAGVVSNLRMMGRDPFAVSFGGGSSDTKYKNKRAECWAKMRDWLTVESGWLQAGQYAEQFKDDLTGPDYCFDLQGRLQLERKEEMRKRGVASPDFADALAVTFAFPITMKRPKREGATWMNGYDPFTWKKRRG
jgi:phage terminase large subunit